MLDGFLPYSLRRVSSRGSLLVLKHLVLLMVQVERIMDLRAHRHRVFEPLLPPLASSFPRRQSPVQLRYFDHLFPFQHLLYSFHPLLLLLLLAHQLPFPLLSLALSLLYPMVHLLLLPQWYFPPVSSPRALPPPLSLLSPHSLHLHLLLLHLLHQSYRLLLMKRPLWLSVVYLHKMMSFRLRCPTTKRWRERREVRWPMMAALCLPPSRC